MARITLNPPDVGTPDLCASCNEVNEMRDSQEGWSLFLGLLLAHKKKPGYTDRAFLGTADRSSQLQTPKRKPAQLSELPALAGPPQLEAHSRGSADNSEESARTRAKIIKHERHAGVRDCEEKKSCNVISSEG